MSNRLRSAPSYRARAVIFPVMIKGKVETLITGIGCRTLRKVLSFVRIHRREPEMKALQAGNMDQLTDCFRHRIHMSYNICYANNVFVPISTNGRKLCRASSRSLIARAGQTHCFPVTCDQSLMLSSGNGHSFDTITRLPRPPRVVRGSGRLLPQRAGRAYHIDECRDDLVPLARLEPAIRIHPQTLCWNALIRFLHQSNHLRFGGDVG